MIAGNIGVITKRTVCQNVRYHIDKTKQKYWYYTVSSDSDSHKKVSGHNSPIPLLLWKGRLGELPQPLVTAMEPELHVLRTIRRFYSRAADCLSFRLANDSARYDETASSYIFRMVKKIKLQVKAHFFDPRNLVSIIGFPARNKLACSTSRIQERAEMWALLFFLLRTPLSWLYTVACSQPHKSHL